MTAHETHRRLFALIQRHGTPDEVFQMSETLKVMHEWRTGLDGTWLPMEEVTLPGFLYQRALRVARERHERAKQFRLRNQHGVTRLLADEERTVMGQYAACLMLGIEFSDVPRSHTTAKAHGNLGGNRSAVIPREGRYGVMVAEDENLRRFIFLINRESERLFKCIGWCRAGEVMKDEYRRTFQRGDTTSHPWIAPSTELLPLADWFKRG